MARSTAFGIVISLLIATSISLAAITPIHDRESSVEVATEAICYLDWPISKLTNRIDMSWQGLALFADSQGCRGVSPDMRRMFALQGIWSAVVYAPIFGVISFYTRNIAKRKAR